MDRWDRKQFFARLAPLDQDQLAKALWTVYWKGTKEVRQRIEAELDPESARRQRSARAVLADPEDTLEEVTEFVTLARAGAYLAGDRRVRPSERTRWRFTFRRLCKEAETGLALADPEPAAEAMELLLDLAREVDSYDYFRSEDPIAAAGIVISDEVEVLWSRLRRHLEFPSFARRAAAQMVSWESQYGWTRVGYGSVADKERSLAQVLEPLLTNRDSWITFADRYLEALEAVVRASAGVRRDPWQQEHQRKERARDLARWHSMLVEHLCPGDGEDRLDRLVASRALAGPQVVFLTAQLANRRGDLERARQLAQELIEQAPRHPEFLEFAKQLSVSPAGKL
jgi:hypothetical protein